jgi:hypothetical protein
MKKLPKIKRSKSLNRLLKYIPPLAIVLVLLIVFFAIKPKSNDNIFSLESGNNAILENINPNFSVQFGEQENPESQWVRFEAKASPKNPFEENKKSFLSKVIDSIKPKDKYGIEMSLKGIQLSQTDQLEGVDEDVLTVAELLGSSEIKTSVELVESGRVIGENNDEPVAKATVINKDVVEGVDIEYQILEGVGLKEEIVIRSLEEYTKECEGNISECKLPLNEFIFDIKLDEGLQLKYDWFTYKGKSTKGYYFTDSKGNYVAHFLPNWAIDLNGSKTYDIDFEIEEKDDNNYEAKVTVDINWLFSPERLYPVRIDPSIVHDTKTEFDTGYNYGTEVVDGPKVQIKEYDPVDSNTIGYWKMDDTDPAKIPKDCSALRQAGVTHSGQYLIDPDGSGAGAPFVAYCDMSYDGGGWTLLDNFVSSNAGDTDPYGAAIGGSNIKTGTDLTNAGYTTYYTSIENTSYTRVNGYLQMFYSGAEYGYIQKTLPSYANQVYVKWGNWYTGTATLSIGGSVVQSLGASYGAATYQGSYSSGNAIRFQENGIFWAGEIWVRDTNASAAPLLTIEDSSGSNNHGIADATKQVDGIDSYAREFDGANDIVQIPDSTDLRMTTGGTISAWIYPRSYGEGNYGRIVDKGTDNVGTNGYYFSLNSATQSTQFRINASTQTMGHNGAVKLYEWQHVAVTFTNTVKKMYLNGEDITASGGTDVGLPPNVTGDIRIGQVANSLLRTFDGYIDEVYMSSSVFTDSEIKEMYLNSIVERDGFHKSSELDLGSNSFLDDITWDAYGDATNEEEPFSTTGLVAQWNFNEKSGTTAASGGSCGSSCNGTLTSMTTTGQDVSISSGWTYNGKKFGDGAIVFDGTDDRVVISSHSSLGLTTGLTIEAWVKPYSYSTGGYNHILDKHGTYGLSIYNGKPSLYMTAGGWWQPDISPLELNKWSHVVATYNGINKTLFVNGRQVAQTLQSGSIGITSNAVGIGATSAGPYYFNGVIDTTRVFSRALTTSEVISHYKHGDIDIKYRTSLDGTTWSEWNGGSEKKIETMEGNLCSTDIHGLVAYYPMDETSGTVMYDANGSNNANLSGSYITEGKHGKSRSFINSSDAAIVSSEISLASTSYTIETWFKWPLTSGGSWNTLTRGSTGDHQVIVQRSTMLLGSYSQDAAAFVSSGFYINTLDDGWHHLAAVASDATTRFFIDGKHVGTAAFKSTRGIYAIGNYQGGGQQFGTIDEFKLYNIELTPQQIYRNFLQGAKINSAISTEKSNIRMEGDSSMRITSSNYSSDGYTAAHWKLDEVSGTGAYLKDSSRFGNNGTPVGAVYSEGKFDGARDFNGSTNYLNIGSAVAPALPVTISAWVRPDSVHSGHIVNTGKNQAAVHYHNGVWMTLYNNQVNIGFGNNTACGPSARREVATASATVPVGKWSHVVGVMESDTAMKIYINGESVTLGAYGGTATFLANDLSLPGSIGAMTDCGSGARTLYFDGKIDEVAIINRAYSNSEVKELYNAGHGNDVGKEIESNVKEGILMTRYPGNVGHPNNLAEMIADFQPATVYTKEIVDRAVHRDFGDYYNTMYSTEMEALVSGTWQFAVDGDDAVIVSVGGTTVAGKYGPGGQCNCFTYAGSISLTAGSKYIVNVWQNEDAGGDSAQLWYKDPNDTAWKHFSVSNISGSAKLRAYDLSLDYVNTSSYITNGMPSLSSLPEYTALPFWIASDKVGTNLELRYGESEYVNYEPDRYTIGHWDLEDRSFLDSSGNNLHGRDYYGIEYGIKSSNLTLIANQWNGVANNGELDITCPGGDAACYIINMDGEQLSTPSINYGAALIENAVQNAFLMYSPSLTGQGITPYASGSNNFIAVRYTSGVWQYDNNTAWVTFTPTTSNILVASLVTGNPTITGLVQITINPPTPTGGKIGNGMQFDGTNYIHLKSPAQLQMTGNQTLEMWLYPTDMTIRRNPFAKAYGGEGTITQETSGVLNYYYGTAGANATPYQSIGSVEPVTPYTWNHIAVVRDLRNMTLTWYINGKMTNTIAATYASATASSLPAYIGNGYTNPYAGIIDEVRLSDIPRSADEIRQSYEIGMRTHPIKVNFKANLLSGNLISSSGDYSFSIDERPYGGNNYIEHLEIGDKIIVKENYNGVEYIAQGNIATRNKDTGAVTVSGWDSGSTFPSGGYTVNSTVFKWQLEYVNLRENHPDDVSDISRLTFSKTTDIGANFWIDDVRLTSYGKTSNNTLTPADSYLYGSSDNSLVAYFPMDETSGQLVKNVASTKSGIATGTTVTTGYSGNARSFDGSSDYISVADTPSLDGMDQLSLSTWVKVNSFSSQTVVPIGKDVNSVSYRINIAPSGQLSFVVATSNNSWYSTGTVVDSSVSLTTGKWYHIAAIYDGSRVRIYVNGQLTGTGSQDISGNILNSDSEVHFGKSSSANIDYFNGMLDEVRVYNRALSADEILLQYDSRMKYVQYSPMFSRWDNNTDLDLYLSGLTVNYTPDGPTMDQVMRHGKWFTGGVKQPYWWAK